MIVMVMVFTGLIARLYVLQILDAPKILATSNKARNYYLTIPSSRGLILDRNQRSLALNKKLYTISIAKDRIANITETDLKKRNENIAETVLHVGILLDLPASSIQRDIAALQSDKIKWREIKKSVSESLKDKVEKSGIAGVEFKPEPARFYPEGSLAAHVVGFTGKDNSGLSGLEMVLNEQLTGFAQPVMADKDKRRRMIAEADYTKIQTRGVDYSLTIDSYIQYVVERELKKVCQKTAALKAHAVVMHPGSGEILAMANYPTYNPNNYQDYSLELRKNSLLTDVFEPGSVLKPFILSAAMEQRVVTPQMEFYCENGFYRFKGKTIRDDIHQFKNLTVHDILVYSSNIGMIKITQRLGENPDDFRGQAKILHNYLSRFGFKNTGERTTQYLPGETGGILRRPNKWQPASIGAIPFGQEMSTNTLVLTAAYCALANRGLYSQPQILLSKRRRDGLFQHVEKPKPLRILSNRVAEQIVQMMIDVTEDPEGTGRMVRIPGFHIAGKTGTAQKYDPKVGTYGRGMRVASFAGFFPAEDPQAAIVVVVDEPKKKKYGGEVAGPVFQKIAEELIAYWGISPTDKTDPQFIAAMNKKAKDASTLSRVASKKKPFGVSRQMQVSLNPMQLVQDGMMPDLTGLSIREAYVYLASLGVKARFEGSGKVVKQPVLPGAVVDRGIDIGVVHCEPALTDPEISDKPGLVVQR